MNGTPHATDAPPQVIMRRMRREDIPQVIEIDRLSFPMPWSANVYNYEMDHNPLSAMVVLAQAGAVPVPPASGFGGWLRRLMGGNGRLHPSQPLFGYGGFWFSRQEAHISTIAVHPAWRGHNLGELLLAGMIRRALVMDAEIVSLEVRVGNVPAIALYRKYGFMQFGVKRSYYRDNNEDAYDLRVSPVDDLYRQRFAAHWEDLRQRLAFDDSFTEIALARRSF